MILFTFVVACFTALTHIVTPATFEGIPSDIFFEIGQYLPYGDFLKLAKTSRTMYQKVYGNSTYFVSLRMRSTDFDPWNRKFHHLWAENHPIQYERFLVNQNSSEERLISAARNGALRLVSHACDNGVDPKTAIPWACESGNAEVLRILLDRMNRETFVDLTGCYREALLNAANPRQLEVLQVILQWRGPRGEWVDPREHNNRAIQTASFKGYFHLVEVLINWRGPNGEWIDPRANDNFAIRETSRYGSIDIVRLLLEWRGPRGEWVDARAEDNMSIQLASNQGRIEVVEALLAWRGPNDEWVDPRARSNWSLMYATRYGHENVVAALRQWRGPQGEMVSV